jgi:hypothetical protein
VFNCAAIFSSAGGGSSSTQSVQKLQTALHAKGKAEPGYRFYALYDLMSQRTKAALAQLAQFGGGLRDFAEGGAIQIK